MSNIQTSLYYYNADECVYKENITFKQCTTYNTANHVCWINIVGKRTQADLEELATVFNIHPLVIEDIAHTEQRAKLEDYGDFHFLVVRMFALIDGKIEDQQISIIIRNNFLMLFREQGYGLFEKQIGEKILTDTGSLRKKGEDYLLYKMLDIIVDNYYLVLDHTDRRIEQLDKEIMNKPDDHHIVELQLLKTDLLYIRKNILPARDLILTLKRNEIEHFDADNKYNLRDLQDHMQRNTEELDFQLQQINSLMDFFYQLQTHKMNNVMKTLTIVSFVFLPLTFIASLYGMNFEIMPHIKDVNGFWQVLTGMGIVAFFLIVFAFRRQWLSTKDFLKQKV